MKLINKNEQIPEGYRKICERGNFIVCVEQKSNYPSLEAGTFYDVGEILNYMGNLVKVKQGMECDYCALYFTKCHKYLCNASKRSDKKDVYFEKI